MILILYFPSQERQVAHLGGEPAANHYGQIYWDQIFLNLPFFPSNFAYCHPQVTTVEDFWSLYNHIEVASKLPPGADYSLFKVAPAF